MMQTAPAALRRSFRDMLAIIFRLLNFLASETCTILSACKRAHWAAW